MAAIEIRNLRKVYRTRRGPVVALDGLDLEVPEGGVFGFLGANGAGKTTAIRALVGHLRPTAGAVRVLGHAVPRGLSAVIDRVGALVEAPSFVPGFSARRNLELLAASRGFPRARVEEVLEAVGLVERADSRYATYSFGMRQRLGVAAALLKDPALLVLDEPANGLDPPGIHAMRVLLRRLGAEGRTVFVSSHILGEVQQTCDRVAIIARGRQIVEGPVAALLAGTTSRYRVRVEGGSREAGVASQVLGRAGFAVVGGADDELLVEVARERAGEVTRTLAEASVFLTELSPVERTLEDVFLELTGDPPGSSGLAGSATGGRP